MIRVCIALLICTWALTARAQTGPTMPDLVVQSGHQHQIGLAAFSSDTRLIATADIRGAIKIWETTTGRQLRTLSGHSGSVSRLAFSSDSRSLASAGDNSPSSAVLVKIWDVATGAETHRLVGYQMEVRDIVFSPDGRLLATSGDDVRLWDTTSGRETERIEAHSSAATLAFSPDGRELAIREPQRLRIWTVGGGASATFPLGNLYGPRTIAFRPDGTRLAVPDGDSLKIFDPSARRIVANLKIGHNFQVLGFADVHCVIRTGRAYEVWNLTTGRMVRTLAARGGSSEVLSPDWQRLAVLNEPSTHSLTLKQIDSSRPPLVLAGRVAVAGAVAFSPDGSLLATKSGVRFWVWDLKTGEPRLLDGHKPASGGQLELDALAFTGDGRSIISGDRLWRLIQWDVASGQIQNTIALTYDKSTITHACSADGRWCASGQQGRVDVWEVASWRVFRTFQTGSIRGLAISDDGAWVAAARAPNEVDLWDRGTGRHRVLTGHRKNVSRVAFSAGGRQLASADFGGSVRLWEPATGRELKVFESGHTEGITSLAFSPGGRQLATGGADDVIKLWDLDPGRLRHLMRGHVDWVAKLAFSPDGKVLASGSGDGTARLWDVDRGSELALLTAANDSPDWLVVTPDGLFDGSYVASESLVAWRVGNSAFPPERYFDAFFRPGLLATLWTGARPRAATGVQTIALPPEVRIVQASGAVLKQPRVPVGVRVRGRAAEVSLYQNGARIGNQPGAPNDISEYTFDVDLVAGDNELRAVATSPAGVASNPDSIRLTYETPLPARPALHVLAVGISRYRDPSWNLGFARADAEALARFFEQTSGKLFHTVSAKVLSDGAATWPNISQALADTASKARPEDVVLLYFAGHGITVERRYYLLPHDMRSEATLDEDVKKFGIPDAALQDSLRKVKAVKRIVILDACESGTALDILARSLTAQRAALEMLARAEGVFIIAASTRQQEAIEIPALGHGVLTYALLSGLGATADFKPTGVVTMYGLLQYVSQKVPELATRYGRSTKQLPVSFHRGMDFPLLVP